MSVPIPPVQPARESYSGAELEAYARVVARQKSYNYADFAQYFPSEHRAKANPAQAPTAAPVEADEADLVQPYMGAMLNSPEIMALISDLGVLYRNAGERTDSYKHSDREWIDMVLGIEMQGWGVIYAHIPDGVANGMDIAALRALREGRDEDLPRDLIIKTRYIRQVFRGTVTAESYAAIEELLGRRGAVEFTAFIGHLMMTIRLIQAFGAQSEVTEQMVDELIDAIELGSVPLPDPSARVPAKIG